MKRRVLRSWPWTAALSAVLTGFVLLGLFGLLLRSSPGEILLSLVLTAAAVLGLARAASMGVVLTPSGLIIRELTRTTLVEWSSVRSITSGPTSRRRIFAPALLLSRPQSATGRPLPDRLELTVLAAYSADVAQRRADELAAARPTTKRRR